MLPQSHASASARTRNARIDQLDPGTLECCNQLHQRIDVSPDHTVAGFHALNRRNRKVCLFGHLPLIDIQKRTSGPELIGVQPSIFKHNISVEPQQRPNHHGSGSARPEPSRAPVISGSAHGSRRRHNWHVTL
jgi:hypothetical protein